MVLSKTEMQKYAMFGAVAGIVTPYVMSYLVLPLLNLLAKYIPSFTATLAAGTPGTVVVNVRESLALGLQASPIGSYLFGLVNFTVPGLLMTAIGGAVVVVAGAYLADMIGMLGGSKIKRLTATILIGTFVASLFLQWALPTLGLGLVNTIIAFGINAAIISYVLVLIDDAAGIGIVP